MPSASLKIAYISSEVEPFSKSGGLANVASALPRAHESIGHKTIVITPFYEGLVQFYGQKPELLVENYQIDLGNGVTELADFYKATLSYSNVPVYFIGHKKFFSGRKSLYGAVNENCRFAFFDFACLELIKYVKFRPNIIHCHDWHSGLIPYLLKNNFADDQYWTKTATLFTIHNLSFQLGHDWWAIPENQRDNGKDKLPSFENLDEMEKINFAKRAILNADAINAVSETYRFEIMTESFGQDLQEILQKREKTVFGIVNGIDYEDYNPATDPGLYTHFSYKSVSRRKLNKINLQKHYGLKVSSSTPLLCLTSRIVEQKGFLLLQDIISAIMRLGVQILIMGDGDKVISSTLSNIQKVYPKQFVFVPFDSKWETSVYAGSDMFLLPSRFEPCGINQLIALRYGCIPIVHHTGGLADTVFDFDPEKKEGNGFVFSRYSAGDLLISIVRALETFKHKQIWKDLIVSAMKEANSWNIPAKKYIDLYKKTIRLKTIRMREKRNE